MDEGTQPKTPIKLIVLAVLFAVMVLSLIGFIIWLFLTPPASPVDPVRPTPSVTPIVEPGEAPAPAELPATGFEGPVAAELPSARPASSNAIQEAPVAVTVAAVPRADEMSAAGIAAADHAVVAQMLFNADGSWGASSAYGASVAAAGTNAVESLARANAYVAGRYGSWAEARAFSDANEGRW